eukprot:TRINITY_DN6505_c0_g2_i1.p1 TRINITY_DN6505_c0_g2~~TRINITY_DN6505_c0_g2_i1.p1  ORF type:complete len:203 (-),score=17.86 TRINITY_DN6505_c0_g2_i1:58-666(-)
MLSEKEMHQNSNNHQELTHDRHQLIASCNNIISTLEPVPREGILKTPTRMADAILYCTAGYHLTLDQVLNDAIFTDTRSTGMVLCKDIDMFSLCEHHFLPFFGKIHIAYIPNGKIIGLSKLARIADLYSRRMQNQERITHQVTDALEQVLEPLGVAVLMDCSHTCVMMRGVEKTNSSTITSSYTGKFLEDSNLKNEFLTLIK